MVLEDYTTYTEVEPDDRIQKTATHIDHRAENNEASYLYKSFGAGHFGDFEHLVDAKSNFDEMYSIGLFWSLQNVISDFYTARTGTVIGVHFYRHDVVGTIIYMRQYVNSVATGDWVAVAVNTWYYMRIKRVGTALTCRIWTNATDRDNNDVGAGSYVDELSITCVATTFQYMYGCNNFSQGLPNSGMDTDIENLDLQEAVPFQGERSSGVSAIAQLLDLI